jgi:DNA-binding NarL/FixJ family response regulator
MNTEPPITLVIADDRPLFRLGLRQLMELDSRLRVVGLAENGEQALEIVRRERPMVVLMDVQMPVLDGIQATAAIRRQHPQVKVLMLSHFTSDGLVTRALEAGARGYLLKDAVPEAIINGVLAVAHGDLVMAGLVADRILDVVMRRITPLEMYDGLSTREREILEMLTAGLATKQVAYRLRITEKTTRNHLSRIYEKLGVHDRAQAVLYATRKGLATP